MRVATRRDEGAASRLRPLLHQGPPLRCFPACVEGALAAAGDGAVRHVVVLAVDGLSVDVARAQWRPSALVELVTTVPSASAPAWLTALTGAGVGEHLVAGMVFARPGGDGLVHAVATERDAPDAGTLVRRGAPTIFERARAQGFATVAHPGVLGNWPGPWHDALLAGAERCTRLRPIGAGPVDEARAGVAEIDATLDASREAAVLAFAYIDLDTAVHARGYDDDVRAAVGLLGAAAERWADRGAEVLAVSDHGLVPVERDDDGAAAWRALEDGDLCRMASGGAGRMRWLYAARGKQRELREHTESTLGELALVTTPEELADAGLIDVTAALRPRLGDVVAIGTDPRFPTPDPHLRWEHGALTSVEMLAPCAAWGRTPLARTVGEQPAGNRSPRRT